MTQPTADTTNAIGRVLRAPCRLIIGPVDLAADRPYGGDLLGHVRACMLSPVGQNYLVESEGLGRPNDILRGMSRFVFSAFLRGWDRAAVEQLMPGNYTEGNASQHAVWQAPGTQKTGKSATGRGVKILVVPDDQNTAPSILLYRAVAVWGPGAQLAFQRQNELGIPLTLECMRDSSGRVLQIGRIEDLTL